MGIPYLPYDRLRPIADDFLGKHNASNGFPIPIEAIVDNDFKIDIVPTPGLHRHFDIDSYITSDFSAIHIDDYVYESRPNRYRFSLAHELSHFLIHQDVFAQLSFSTIGQWKESVTSIPEKEYGLLEFQANSLAGLILVPPNELANRFGIVASTLKVNDLDINDPAVLDRVESHLADQFKVSKTVILRRLEFDNLP
jgi:Zn-dependent peptidase ImmA (M78 family)